MPTYRVKLTYKYSDTLEIEADSEEEAVVQAMNTEETNEQFECLYDCEVLSETE